jgi:hypothetical protein
VKEEYIMFKMKRERAMELLHSCNYYSNIIKAHGHQLTGMYPRFVEELQGLLRRQDDSDNKCQSKHQI